MNEINIILDSNIELDDSLITIKNDKKILFNKINSTLNILNLDSSLKNNDNLIEYKLSDIIYLDNYVEFLAELENINQDSNEVVKKSDSTFSKKVIIKKLLEFLNPIIDDNNILNVIHKSDKKKIIIDKNQILLNYKINAKYINKKISTLDLKNYIIPVLNHFNILGLYNNKIQYLIPYKLNEFSLELNNIFNKISIHNAKIFIKSLQYSNKALFTLDTVNTYDLIKLYNYNMNKFELYTNNKEILNNVYNINKDISIQINEDNDNFIIYFNKNVPINKKIIDIDKCNLFLTHKIGNYFSNNIYNSFNNDGLLNLYENIYLYSLDNDKTQNIIKNILDQKKYQKEYQNNLSILENKILINNKLEYIAKKKFPNLFNVNSKENIFNKFNKFDINKIPKKK